MRKGLDDKAADMLRKEILTGEVEPGSRLVEARLAEKLDVSQGTIRAALKLLAREGLVVHDPFRGTSVKALTPEDAWEIYTLRNTLEAMGAKLAAERITPDKARMLKEAFVQLVTAVDESDWQVVMEADYNLHRVIFEMSAHKRLQEMYAIIETQTRLYINATGGLCTDLAKIPALHERLVEAVMNGDADRAQEIAADHNTEDGETLVKMLRQMEQNHSSTGG
ncbi:GntR family transcriptional regulator [Brevibacillus sp. NRS-1366]|uniref:GntR family transcriptional regulator n=1 Tax=Brevibacillus sp. NRS-1366 TaxID=3233899 RepID=UPI003D21A14B